jgi:hypothetical protein
MNSLDPPEHVFIHHSCFVQDFALRLRAGRSDIKSRYDLGEFEATAHMHLHAFIRVVPDAKDAIAGNIETLYSLLVLHPLCSSVAPSERCLWSTCKLCMIVWSVLRWIRTLGSSSMM